MQDKLIPIPVKQILNGLIPDNDNITTFVIRHIFRNPCISESRVSGLGKHIIAVITRIVFEIAKPPVRGRQFSNALDNRFILIRTTYLNCIIRGTCAGSLVSEVHTCNLVKGHARFPRFGLAKEIRFQMSAYQADAIGNALH